MMERVRKIRLEIMEGVKEEGLNDDGDEVGVVIILKWKNKNEIKKEEW